MTDEPENSVSATKLRREYLKACRREGIKPDIDRYKRQTGPGWLLSDTDFFDALPEVKEFATAIDRLIRWLQLEFPAAVKVGKLSPEARQYIAHKLGILVTIAQRRIAELERDA